MLYVYPKWVMNVQAKKYLVLKGKHLVVAWLAPITLGVIAQIIYHSFMSNHSLSLPPVTRKYNS